VKSPTLLVPVLVWSQQSYLRLLLIVREVFQVVVVLLPLPPSLEENRNENESICNGISGTETIYQYREDDRCLHVVLLYDIRYKCHLNLPLREQPLLPSLDVLSLVWVITCPSQGGAAEILPKMIHDPIYPS